MSEVRRYGRALILIGLLVVLAGLVLGFQRIDIGEFERGGNTLLGLDLGLDLQGGIHLVYRANLRDPDTGELIAPTEDQMEALRRTIERRINASGLGEPIIQILGGDHDRLLIQLPGVRDPDRAKGLIGETARLAFKHRMLDVARELEEITAADIVGVTVSEFPQREEGEADTTTSVEEEEEPPIPEEGSQPETSRVPALIVEFTSEGAERFEAVLERLNESLVSTGSAQVGSGSLSIVFPNRLDISVEGEESSRFELAARPVVRLPGGQWVVLPGDPLIERVEESNAFALNMRSASEDVENALEKFGEHPVLVFNGEVLGRVDEEIREGSLTGDDLARAFPSQHTVSGEPIVSIEFKERGTRIFGELTRRIAGSPNDRIAIFLDDEELIAPVVNTAITTGAAIIQGRDFTIERVKDLGLLLESGRLPLPIELIQERDVDAILGADSLAKSVMAGLVGLALVLLFMVLYYRVPGLIASAALLVYAALVLAVFKILPVTLTLSGIAAMILSIGMAVDANILIFERMKDELRAGRTLLSSINNGFNRAWPAIRDGNVSTLITCGILFWFADQLGATIVKGFAGALAIGVAISMFTAITVSRTLLRVVATTGLSRRLRLFVPSGGAQLPQQRAGAPSAQRS